MILRCRLRSLLFFSVFVVGTSIVVIVIAALMVGVFVVVNNFIQSSVFSISLFVGTLKRLQLFAMTMSHWTNGYFITKCCRVFHQTAILLWKDATRILIIEIV